MSSKMIKIKKKTINNSDELNLIKKIDELSINSNYDEPNDNTSFNEKNINIPSCETVFIISSDNEDILRGNFNRKNTDNNCNSISDMEIETDNEILEELRGYMLSRRNNN